MGYPLNVLILHQDKHKLHVCLYERMAYADVITNFSFIDCFPISTAIKAPLPRMPRSYTSTKPLSRSKHTLTSFGGYS